MSLSLEPGSAPGGTTSKGYFRAVPTILALSWKSPGMGDLLRHTGRESNEHFENHQQARCLGEWMDKRNSLLQCSQRILARGAAAQGCGLAATGRLRNSRHCPLRKQAQFRAASLKFCAIIIGTAIIPA